MYCKGFRVIAQETPGGGTFLGLVNLDAEKLAKERRANVEEQKRKAFKP
jgi:hypothetical protein